MRRSPWTSWTSTVTPGKAQSNSLKSFERKAYPKDPSTRSSFRKNTYLKSKRVIQQDAQSSSAKNRSRLLQDLVVIHCPFPVYIWATAKPGHSRPEQTNAPPAVSTATFWLPSIPQASRALLTALATKSSRRNSYGPFANDWKQYPIKQLQNASKLAKLLYIHSRAIPQDIPVSTYQKSGHAHPSAQPKFSQLAEGRYEQ